MPWEVRYYVTPNGRCPYDDWFGSLDAVVQNYIASTLDRTAEEEHLGDCPTVGREEVSVNVTCILAAESNPFASGRR